jgi:DNA topoisomerase-2
MSATDDNTSGELFFDVQQKTDKQHILDNPDTYIGSVEKIDSQQWILNDDNTKIFERNIEYVPGLFKLFDEGIVNARDHSVRMTQAIDNGQHNALPVTNIEITIENTEPANSMVEAYFLWFNPND